VTSLADLLALLPDNTTGDISPADLRTIVTALYGDANPPYTNVVNQGPATLAAVAGTWTTVPGTSLYPLTLDDPGDVQFVLSTNVDSMVNSNQIQVALDLSGATTVAAGSKPEQVLLVGGKQQVQARLEVTFIQALAAGTTNIGVKYTAQAAGGVLSAMAALATVVSAP
jgi:hypothetical protein